MLIKGTTVRLWENTAAGFDILGNPIFEPVPVLVENVIAAPVSNTDQVEALALEGRHGVIQLGIPKGDAHNWEHARVDVFGHKYKTFGFYTEGIEENVPGAWHRIIQAERYE